MINSKLFLELFLVEVFHSIIAAAKVLTELSHKFVELFWNKELHYLLCDIGASVLFIVRSFGFFLFWSRGRNHFLWEHRLWISFSFLTLLFCWWPLVMKDHVKKVKFTFFRTIGRFPLFNRRAKVVIDEDLKWLEIHIHLYLFCKEMN